MEPTTPEQFKLRWEVIALSKHIYARQVSLENFDVKSGKWETTLNVEDSRKLAVNCIKAAEIFFEELAKHQGAT